MDPYATAFLDWLACAIGGSTQRAARAAAQSGDRVLSLAAAGHVLDFDDTYAPGLAHLSAPTAPAALVLAAETGATVGEMLGAYADGFEAMGALARASHPALYNGGWHPTAVCGGVGAAVAAARLLGADREAAVAIALLRAGGLRAAFGSDGKALQVGMATSSGVLAARLAAAGATVTLADAARGPAGFEVAFGARYAEPASREAIRENWIKAWPCCLQTHGAIEAADRARADGLEPGTPVELRVHPISVKAAAQGPRPPNGLAAKFSIPYLAAYTLIKGPPEIESFEQVDRPAADLAEERIAVVADSGLGESEAVLSAEGYEARLTAAIGSPGRPLDSEMRAAKLCSLGAGRLDRALDDPGRPAATVLQLLGI